MKNSRALPGSSGRSGMAALPGPKHPIPIRRCPSMVSLSKCKCSIWALQLRNIRCAVWRGVGRGVQDSVALPKILIALRIRTAVGFVGSRPAWRRLVAACIGHRPWTPIWQSCRGLILCTSLAGPFNTRARACCDCCACFSLQCRAAGLKQAFSEEGSIRTLEKGRQRQPNDCDFFM